MIHQEASTAVQRKARKKKAPTLKEHDWERHKDLILQLHVTQDLVLRKVREILETEHGFTAETRQYRYRISRWGFDKNVKKKEYQAIVRKRQHRKIDEPSKPGLAFQVRGVDVSSTQIDAWMRHHGIAADSTYDPGSPPADTPEAVKCHDIPGRDSPTPGRDELSEERVGDRLGGSSREAETSDLSWSLNTPWEDLIRGHPWDVDGSPLGALASSLLKKHKERGPLISAGTLAELLRDALPQAKPEWSPCHPITLNNNSNDRKDSDKLESEAKWWLSVLRTSLGDSLDTLLISVSMRSLRGSIRTPCWLTMRLRWSGAGYHQITGRAICREIVDPTDQESIYAAIRERSTLGVQRSLSMGVSSLFVMWVYKSPVALSAYVGDFEMNRFLVDLGATVDNAVKSHYSILWPIWEGFAERWSWRTSKTWSPNNGHIHRPTFEDDFTRCKKLTSFALEQGARVDECIRPHDFEGNLLFRMSECSDLKQGQWIQLLQHLLEIGVELDARNYRGQTALLYAASRHCDNEKMITTLLNLGADILLKDNTGKGYLHQVLAVMTNVCTKSSFSNPQWERRLVALLRRDPSLALTMKGPNTPLWYLIGNNEAWKIWAAALIRLGWSHREIETTRLIMNEAETTSDF